MDNKEFQEFDQFLRDNVAPVPNAPSGHEPAMLARVRAAESKSKTKRRNWFLPAAIAGLALAASLGIWINQEAIPQSDKSESVEQFLTSVADGAVAEESSQSYGGFLELADAIE